MRIVKSGRSLSERGAAPSLYVVDQHFVTNGFVAPIPSLAMDDARVAISPTSVNSPRSRLGRHAEASIKRRHTVLKCNCVVYVRLTGRRLPKAPLSDSPAIERTSHVVVELK